MWRGPRARVLWVQLRLSAADEAPVEVIIITVPLKHAQLVAQGECCYTRRATSAIPGCIASLLGPHESWNIPPKGLNVFQDGLLQ